MRSLLLLVLAACSVGHAHPPPPQAAAGVRFFGHPPPKDQRGRIGIRDAPQVYTPPTTSAPRLANVRVAWSARVGKTDAQTTMALADGKIILGSHGASLQANNEASDGVYVVDAVNGAVLRQIRTPGDGDLDVSGVAVDGDRIFFTSDNGQVTCAKTSGLIEWSHLMKGTAMGAPALADLDGDGRLDVVAGDGTGSLDAFDGKSGRVLWQRKMTSAIVAAPAIADADQDGKPDVIAIDGQGLLGVYRGRDGGHLWSRRELESSSVAPTVADVNADGRKEILAAWSTGKLELLDLGTGRVRWSTEVRHDDGSSSLVVGTPIVMPGNTVASIVVPTDRGVVVQAQHARSYRSGDESVKATGVVARLEPSGPPMAIFGNASGDVIALDTLGKRVVLAHLEGAIESSALLGDGNQDGLLEIYVASNDGALTCLQTTAPAPAWLARHRGDSLSNTGAQPDAEFGWRLAEIVAER